MIAPEDKMLYTIVETAEEAVRVIYDFAAAFHARRVHPDHLLRSLTPLYMGRVASFVAETRESLAGEVEEKMEKLCLLYEQEKPYLIEQWPGSPAPQPEAPPDAAPLHSPSASPA